MDNQHRKITGYRELSQEEIDLMNKIKALGPQIEEVIESVLEYIDRQQTAAFDPTRCDLEQAKAERELIIGAEPGRWTRIGATHLQEGLMALTRAIAKPTSF